MNLSASTSKYAAAALATAATVILGLGLLQGAHSTARFAEDNACAALRPNPLIPELAAGAPDFEVKDLQGKPVTLRQFRGKPVLLSFFATWCPPCVEEIPTLELLAGRLGDQATVLVVSVDEDLDALKKFFAGGSKTLVTHDETREIPGKFGTTKFPDTYLVDTAGKVRNAFINKRDWTLPQAVACVVGAK